MKIVDAGERDHDGDEKKESRDVKSCNKDVSGYAWRVELVVPWKKHVNAMTIFQCSMQQQSPT